MGGGGHGHLPAPIEYKHILTFHNKN
jgi:hypothetical protein